MASGNCWEYEQEHGNRLSVVQLLKQRMHALESGQAMPSPGDPGAEQPSMPRRLTADRPGTPPRRRRTINLCATASRPRPRTGTSARGSTVPRGDRHGRDVLGAAGQRRSREVRDTQMRGNKWLKSSGLDCGAEIGETLFQ